MKLVKSLGQVEYGTKGMRCLYGIYECPKCGVEIKVRSVDVTKGRTTMCSSCAHKQRRTTYEYRNSHIYRTWRAIKTRVTNTKIAQAKDYSGRGISMCEEWSNSFDEFYKWANDNGYKENLTIDRINNDGNYEPNNCRWTTQSQQMCNTRELRSTNTSGYRGVNSSGNKFLARIQREGKRINIGRFETAIEAAIAYNKYIDDNKLDHCKNSIGGVL